MASSATSTSDTDSSRWRRPAFENIETLLGKYGDEGNKLIFKILRRGEQEAGGGADLALRYDLTVPLARVVARYQNELPRFFKRYQIQPVWRADRPARGRFREFFQCDIDAIGSTSNLVEVELLAAVSDVLERLGFDDFTIRLNHRELLSGLLATAGVPPPLHADALVAIDKLDKIGADGVHAELVARGVDAGSARHVPRAVQGRLPGGDADAAARRRAGGARRRAARNDRPARRANRRIPAHSCRSESGSRPVILHGRDHGDRGPRSGRQPRRRRAGTTI